MSEVMAALPYAALSFTVAVGLSWLLARTRWFGAGDRTRIRGQAPIVIRS